MKRRDFLKTSSTVAAAATLGTSLANATETKQKDDISRYAPTSLKPEYTFSPDGELIPNPDQRMAFSMCYGCYSTCSVRARIDNNTGKILRVAGNPYAPSAQELPLNLNTPVRDALKGLSAIEDLGLEGRAALCGRGNAVVDAMKDPHRITQCLKRVGARGENKWQTISYEQMIQEVTEGGNLFGEGHVDGLKAIYNNHALANTAYPDFGPGKNQLLATGSSSQAARKGFFDRFHKQSWGTPNIGTKSAYCGVVTGAMGITAPYTADINHCEYAIYIGHSPGMTGDNRNISARRLANALERDNFKCVIVDPILRSNTNKASHKNSEWLPIRPGADTALVFALLQQVINKERYNERFLAIPGRALADKRGEVNYSNATHLVVKSENHALYNQFLTAAAMGLGDQKTRVVIDKLTGQPVANSSLGDARLMFEGTVTLPDGSEVQVETSMSLLKKRINEKTPEQYASYCAIPLEKIAEMATEFTSHGRRVAITHYTGISVPDTSQMAYAMGILGTMVAAHNAKGGMNYGTGSMMGGKYKVTQSPLYNLMDFEQAKIVGTNAERFGKYEQSHEYLEKVQQGLPPYPANEPWIVTNRAIGHSGAFLVAHANESPYHFKAWINWSANPFYGCPGLQNQVKESVRDPKKLGLFVAVDAYINETNQFADYFVPDLVQYEQWSMARMGASLVKGESACAPIVESQTVKTASGQPVCMEQFLIDVAKRLEMNGFGEQAFSDTDGKRHPIHTPEDYYVPLYANLAHAGTPLPSATEDEIKLTSVDRLAPLFKERLKQEELGPTLFMLTRGGRYEPLDNLYDGEFFHKSMRSAFECKLYDENIARKIHSHSGKHFDGLPVFDEPRFWDGTAYSALWKKDEYPFVLAGFKSNLRSPYSVVLPRITALGEENFIQMHEDDARKAGLKNGDNARVKFGTGTSFIGVVQADKSVAKGVVSVGHGFGHTAMGAQDITIDGTVLPGIKARSGGICSNFASANDPTVKGASLLREMYTGASIRHAIPIAIEKV